MRPSIEGLSGWVHVALVVPACMHWHSVRVLIAISLIFLEEEGIRVGLPLGLKLSDALRCPKASRVKPVAILSKLKKLVRAYISLTVAICKLLLLLLELQQLKLLHPAAVVLEDLLLEAEQVCLGLAFEVRVVVQVG